MATVSDQQNPRKLIASTAYVKLLSDRDEANKVAVAVADATPTELQTGGTGTANLSFKLGSSTITSAVFSKYAVSYLIKNIKTLAPSIMDLITADIMAQKTEAEMEMGLNGLSVTPIVPLGPVIISSLTPSNATTTQAWTYQIVADNISGPGINGAAYALADAPSWLSVNAATGLVQGVPQQADIGENTFDVVVTTNISSDTKTVTLEVVSHALPIVQSGQTITGTVGYNLTFTPQAQFGSTGNNGITTVEWGVADDSANPLPDGLNINTTTGVISGTPTTAATTTVSIELTNNFGSDVEDFTFNIKA